MSLASVVVAETESGMAHNCITKYEHSNSTLNKLTCHSCVPLEACFQILNLLCLMLELLHGPDMVCGLHHI